MLKYLLALFAVLMMTTPLFAAGGGGHGPSDLPPFPRPLDDYIPYEQEKLAELITAGKVEALEGYTAPGEGSMAPAADVHQTVGDHAVDEEHATGVDPEVAALGVIETLKVRIEAEPLNLVVTLLFFGAILHTFFAGKFMKIAHDIEHKHKERVDGHGRRYVANKEPVSFKATFFHFLGEVEAIFGIWVLPLFLVITFWPGYGWDTAVHYIDTRNYTEPVFVVIIMAIASSRPVLQVAQNALRVVANIGKQSPAAWWLSILTIAPILGSFITEPAAMTIAALLLGQQFYKYKPASKFAYATLGLLFVNISVGGTLSHFAAPPVLMVASTWNWDFAFMFTHFGWRAVGGILVSNAIYFFVFRKHFAELASNRAAMNVSGEDKEEEPVPVWIMLVHLFFIGWTVMMLHHPPLFIGGFLVFIAFIMATSHHQYDVSLKGPLLVGFFLAALVIHGGLQGWWIAPVLGSLAEVPLFIGSTVLTAFNDNAAITYLASQVPAFSGNMALQYAVVAGAVTGGGLTVIANAPNPAGQSILGKFFQGGISPLGLLLGALIPTLIQAVMFIVLPH